MSSQTDVFTYCCKKCGFDLNLSSADRKPEGGVTKLWHAMKMGSMSFAQIDQSRLFLIRPGGQYSTSEVNCECNCCCCYQYEKSSETETRRTKLLCASCRSRVGVIVSSTTFTQVTVANASGVDESKSGSATTYRDRYKIRVGAVVPSSN